MEFIRPKKTSLALDMAPLIDIVFQLLIFFMLSSSFLVPSMKLTLPKAVQHDEKIPEQVVVSVDKDGAVYLNTVKTSMDELKSALALQWEHGATDKSVHIRGDQDMAYKYFVEVMNIARQAGARQVNIMHEADPATSSGIASQGGQS